MNLKKGMLRLRKLQKEIGDWQRETFKKATTYGVYNHMSREMSELNKALNRHVRYDNEDTYQEVRYELADIIILAVALADLVHVDLDVATKEKMKINKARKWGKPDADGVVEHIKEG